MDILRKTFVAEATKKLAFLLDEESFTGPEVQGDDQAFPLLIRVLYHRSDFDVEVSLVMSYAGEEYVITQLLHADDASDAAKHTAIATSTAHTGCQMRHALDQHGRAIRDAIKAPGSFYQATIHASVTQGVS